MKKLHVIAVLLMAGALMLAMSAAVFAESYSFEGDCAYNGDEIKASFNSDEFAASQKNLEPGDEVSYTLKYTNNSKEVTSWYMRNSVLETLEEAKDAAENGGYTYKLVNVDPQGKETVLFDNSEVGGETKVGDLEGLKQATNATGEYFFIQKLKAGESGQTKLSVALDGETEVNDYMNTRGSLMVSYAVENDTQDEGEDVRVVEQTRTTTSSGNPGSTPRTGDPMDMLKYILMMVAAVIVGFFAVLSWRRDRKEAATEAAAEAAVEAGIDIGTGKDGDKA